MSAPQAFEASVDLDHVHAALWQGGRTSKQVNVSLHVGRELLLFPPGSASEGFETAGDHCHAMLGTMDQFGTVMLAACCLGCRENVALNGSGFE
jgi:hypothetical protein